MKFHTSRDFLRDAFKKVEKFYTFVPYKKERFTKLKIKTDSEHGKKNQKITTLVEPEGMIGRISAEILGIV